MKKIILLLLMSCMLFAGTLSASAKDDNLQTFMQNLGFIDSDYNLDGTMTKSELAKMLSVFFENDTAEHSQNRIYSDITAETKNSNEINKLALYGIFTSTTPPTKFNPDNKISLDDMAQVLVKMLGYDVVASPAEYVRVAGELGLYKGVSSNESLNYNALVMLDNALDANILQIVSYNPVKYEESYDKTLLSQSLKLKKQKGRLNAVGEMALTASYKVALNKIAVGDTVMSFEDKFRLYLMENLGANVEVYYTDSDEYTLVHIGLCDTERITINEKDYISLADGQLSYYTENGSTKTEKVNAYSYIVYNNRPINDMPQFGKNTVLTFISSECNGVYDIIIIKEYTDYIVEEYKNDKIIMKYTGESIDLENCEDITFYNEEKELLELSKLKKGSVISLISFDDGIEIVLSEKSVYGIVDSTRDYEGRSYITVKGNEYEFSEQINNESASGINKNTYIGVEGNFVLNCFGRICGIDIVKTSIKYGYLIWVMHVEEDDTVVAKLFNSLGQFEKLNVKAKGNKISIDGAYQSYSLFISNNSSGGAFTPTLIGYETNYKGEISNIEMPSQEARDGLHFKTSITSDKRFRTGVNSFGSAAIISADAQIFVVPEDVSDSNSYRVVSPTFFSGDARYKNLYFYGYEPDEITAPLVVYKASSSTANLSNGTTMIVTDIRKSINSNGEELSIIEGIGGAGAEKITYMGAPGLDISKTTYTAPAATMSNEVEIEIGDIVRGRYSQANSYYYQIELMYDASEKTWMPSTAGIVWNDYDAIRCGKIKAVYNGHMHYTPIIGTEEKFYKCPAKYFTVTVSNSRVYIEEASSSDIVRNESDVVFYDNYDRCRWIAIYN